MFRRIHRSVNIEPTLLGLERRLSMLGLIIAFLLMRHVSLKSAAIFYSVFWGVAYYVTKYDAQLVTIFPKVLFQKHIYDPFKG